MPSIESTVRHSSQHSSHHAHENELDTPIGGGAADAAAPTPTRPIGRAKLSGGPRPSPGTYADNVNASISPYTP